MIGAFALALAIVGLILAIAGGLLFTGFAKFGLMILGGLLISPLYTVVRGFSNSVSELKPSKDDDGEGTLHMSKTLGQVAYEAAAAVTGCEQPWAEATQAKWEAAGEAAARQFCEGAGLDRAEARLIDALREYGHVCKQEVLAGASAVDVGARFALYGKGLVDAARLAGLGDRDLRAELAMGISNLED